MWGCQRNKETSFGTSSEALEVLRWECNHQPHEHESWGLRWYKTWKFETEEECEYPKEFCQAIARAVTTVLGVPDPASATRTKEQATLVACDCRVTSWKAE